MSYRKIRLFLTNGVFSRIFTQFVVMIITDIAIILHGRKFSDTSKIIHVYTKEHGKVSVIAKGVRSAKHTMGSALEALRCSSITWYKYPNKDLHLLKSAEISIPLHHLTSEYEILMSAMGILEIVSSTQEMEESHPEVFELALQALMTLNQKDAIHVPYLITLQFMFNLAHLMGFGMHVSHCPITGDVIDPSKETTLFSFSHGGCVSDDVMQVGGEHISLHSSALKILQMMSDSTFNSMQMECSMQDQITLLDLFQRYFSYHSHKTFRWNTYPPGISTQ